MVTKEIDVIDKSEDDANLESNMKLLRNLRLQHIIDINMVRVFVIIWLAATILAIPPIFRPKRSEVEKRDLKTFPKFSFSSLAKGDYFDEISLWFSDTFPLRDGLVALNTKMTNTFGINTVQVHGQIEQGDVIPDITSSQEVSVESEPETQPKPESEPETESEPEIEEPAVEQLGAMLIVDNAAYEYYNFNKDTADKYASAVNRAAKKLKGKAQVYDVVIPTSMAITLPENFKGNTNSSDQQKAIDYMYSRMSKNVTKVNIYSTLIEHKDEYIYFRTDHHWTARGAYYAYRDLMTAAKKTPAKLSAFKKYKYKGFLGSFYAQSGQKASLGDTPDYVMAYEPTQTNEIYTRTKNGNHSYCIVSDGNAMSEANKYLVFVGGDQPYGVMTNPTITDDSACLVIKESFGNAMVPFLTQNYRYVHVMDYRYVKDVYSGTLEEFVIKNNIQDVMFVNNISATRNAALVNAISTLVGK